MKRKNYEPINFQIFQSDMELYMYILDNPTLEGLKRIKRDFQHKIDIHRDEGDWI